MKKIFVTLVLLLALFPHYVFSAIGINEIYTFNTKQKQWYQAYLYDVFPQLSAAQLTDIEIMRIQNMNEFEYNIKWINATYNIIDLALDGAQIVGSNEDDIIKDLIKINVKNYLKNEFGNTGETIGFVADELYELYTKGKKTSLLAKLSIISYSAQRISKVQKAVDFWSKYSDITKRQLSLLIVDKYLVESIRNAQCINISEDHIESLAEDLGIDTGWIAYTRDYDLEFTIREANRYCYYLNYNALNYTGDYPKSIENQSPEKPNIFIVGGNDNTILVPTIKANSYKDVESDAHTKTWWGIYQNDSLIKDFGWKSNNKYSFTLPPNVLKSGKRYKVAVAFMDSNGNYSKAKFLPFNTKEEDIQLYDDVLNLPNNYFSKANNICDDKAKYNCKNNKYDILYMQMLLNADDNLQVIISEDGVWGDETRKSIMKFQAYYGLTIDGIIGFGTRSKLDSVLASEKGGVVTSSGVVYEPFLTLPFKDDYTYENTPISSIFDHTQNNDGFVIAFDGTTAKKDYNIEKHGSCYMTKYKNDIVLQDVNYVGTDSDSSYLCYDATGEDKHRHRGIDYSVPIGTSVYASASGTVEFSGTQLKDGKPIGFGNYIKINHHNGFATYYGHLSSMNVSTGEKVSSGQYIGKSGNSGNVSAHLHFDVRRCASTVGECIPIGRVDPFGFMGINNLWNTDENQIEKPDMIVLDTEIETVMKSGESYSPKGTVQNIGDSLAKDIELTFYISDDNIITSNDTPIGSYYNFGNIDSKQHKTENITIVASRSWNKKYIGACVTSTSQEITTSNNCKVSGYVYVSENDYVDTAPYLKLYDYRIDNDPSARSDGDGKIENGEWIDFDVKLKNIGGGTAQDVSVSLDTSSECVSIVHPSTSFLNVESGQKTAYGEMVFSFDDCAKNEQIVFDIKITADDEYEWHDSITIKVVDDRVPSDIEFVSFSINDDNERSSMGNGDGKANLGEILEIYPSVENIGDIEANNVKAYLSTTDSCVEIIDDDTRWNDIKPGEYIEGGEYDKDSRTRFKVKINPYCAVGHRVNFNLHIVSDEGEWHDNFSFKVHDMPTDSGLSIIDYNITDDRCHDNLGFWHEVKGTVNPCDKIDIDIKLNNESSQRYGKINAIVETFNDSCVDMKDKTYWLDVNASSNAWSYSGRDIDFTVSDTCEIGHVIEFFVTFETDMGVWTDSFMIQVEEYHITPDLRVSYLRPSDLTFNMNDTIEFEARVTNDGDRVVNDSVLVEIKASEEQSCTSSYLTIGYITVPALGDYNSKDGKIDLEVKKEWNGKYLIAEVSSIRGEVNLENNCYIGDKITVLFEDFDNDGIVDNYDTDIDGDDVNNTEDAFPRDASEWLDTDMDGIGNNADTDDDGDGVLDNNDDLPLNPNESVDTDNDGKEITQTQMMTTTA